MLKIACTVGSGSVYGRFSQKKNISRLGGKVAIEPKLSKKLERSEGSRNKISDIAKIFGVRFSILIPRTVTQILGQALGDLVTVLWIRIRNLTKIFAMYNTMTDSLITPRGAHSKVARNWIDGAPRKVPTMQIHA